MTAPAAILHLSDLHLEGDGESPARGLLFESLVAAVGRIASEVECALKLVVVTGDIFDSSGAPDSAVERFATLLAEIRAALGHTLPCVLLPGNHDRRRAGVVGPHDPTLFARLAARRLPSTVVAGCRTPTLVEWLPFAFHGLAARIAVYDSTFLPRGLLGAGGWLRGCELLEIADRLRRDDCQRPADEPLILLTHHHLIPTPITDVGEIQFDRIPRPLRAVAQRALSGLIAQGDREELTMTALGAGSALTLLQTLGHPVVVLHGHKHYPTVRLLRGVVHDQSDVLLASAGSGGTVERWRPEGAISDLGIWPSFNVVVLDGPRLSVEHVGFSDDDRAASRHRTLAKVVREGSRWTPLPFKVNRGVRRARLDLDERRCHLHAKNRSTGLYDLESVRLLTLADSETVPRYLETVRGCPGSDMASIVDANGARNDLPLPQMASLLLNGETRYHLREAVCSRRDVAQRIFGVATNYEWIGLLVRYGAKLARLVLTGLPDGVERAFGGVTDLTTGFETPIALERTDERLVLRYHDCPARTRLRIIWSLPES
jgi:3',5'-cyclic AMP phosphodiesterase CpdA